MVHATNGAQTVNASSAKTIPLVLVQSVRNKSVKTAPCTVQLATSLYAMTASSSAHLAIRTFVLSTLYTTATHAQVQSSKQNSKYYANQSENRIESNIKPGHPSDIRRVCDSILLLAFHSLTLFVYLGWGFRSAKAKGS